jgi:MFS family permease
MRENRRNPWAGGASVTSPIPASYPPPSSAVSAWSPFRHRTFALLWAATLISNIGTWMHDVGAGWLMTTLSPSPAIVALVQAATTAPMFLFALFAGALADRVDKRRFLLIVNLVLTGVTAVMATLTAAGAMTPALLLAFTFAIGTGAALTAPAWQAVVPSLVPHESLQPAIALNSMGINIARAIGPALAGFLISAVALSAPFRRSSRARGASGSASSTNRRRSRKSKAERRASSHRSHAPPRRSVCTSGRDRVRGCS